MPVLLGILDWIADAIKNVVVTVTKPAAMLTSEISGKMADKAVEVMGVKKILEDTTSECLNKTGDALTFNNQNMGDAFLNKIILNSGKYGSNGDWKDVWKFFSGKYFISLLMTPPREYFKKIDSTNIYDNIIKMMQEGTMPTAMVIFSLIILVELFQITTRTEGMRNSGFEAPFKLMFKVAICKILLDNTHNVLDAITDTGLELVNALKAAADSHGGDNIFSGFADAVTKMNFNIWRYIFVLFLALVLFVFVNFITLTMCFQLLTRVIEVYIMIVLAPIPFATFAHQELSQIGKNFLKQFFGMALKPAVMYIVLFVYLQVMNSVIMGESNNWRENAANQLLGFIPMAISFIKILVLCAMMASALANSDKFTKMITGAFY